MTRIDKTAIMGAVAFLLLVLVFAGIGHSQVIDAGPNTAAAIGETAVESPGVEAPAEPAKATPTEKVESDPVSAATDVVNDIKGGNWRMAAAGLLAFLMMGLTKIRKKVKWFDGDRGGAILVGILGAGGALSTTLASGAKLDVQLMLGTVGVIWTAVGGYTWIKQLIWPRDKKTPEVPASGS